MSPCSCCPMRDRCDHRSAPEEVRREVCSWFELAERYGIKCCGSCDWYGCAYSTALTEGPATLTNPRIRVEIQRLKEIKRQSLFADVDDLVEKQMRIAFADLSDYIEWGREEVPVMAAFGPVQVTDPETGEKVPLMKEVNAVRFKESSQVDGSVLEEVKVGRDGASVKLANRDKALQWLSTYFMANPMDQHKVEYDQKRLELEEKVRFGEAGPELADDPLSLSLIHI